MSADRQREVLASTWWTRLKTRLPIARRIFRAHPTMPATAFWRIYEAEVALSGLRGRGRGLDLGCGDGSFASALFTGRPGMRWVGLEKDGIDAEIARGTSHYEEVHVCPGEEMPFADASFDVVFSNCVLEHVEGLDAVLAHVSRVLKPGGRFVFTVPSETFHEALFIPRVLRRLGLSRLEGRYLRHLDERLEMVNLLSADEWRQKLASNRLHIRHDAPYATRRVAGLWELMANLTGGVAYRLARGKSPPRQIQQSAGMVGGDRRWLGNLLFALLLPVILVTAVQPSTGLCAGWYAEATKEDEAR